MGILIIVPSWNRHRRDLYHNRAIIEAQVCFLVKDANQPESRNRTAAVNHQPGKSLEENNCTSSKIFDHHLMSIFFDFCTFDKSTFYTFERVLHNHCKIVSNASSQSYHGQLQPHDQSLKMLMAKTKMRNSCCKDNISSQMPLTLASSWVQRRSSRRWRGRQLVAGRILGIVAQARLASN